jgi:flagellar hook-basal body complex protein FliE
MAMGSLTVTPNAAAQAYAKVASEGSAGGSSGAGSEGFGAALSNALGSAVQTGQQADAMAAQGLNGQGDLTQIVTSVTQAQLALQTTVARRDRMVQAYQSIMNMPI